MFQLEFMVTVINMANKITNFSSIETHLTNIKLNGTFIFIMHFFPFYLN
jgi:hypothetical protein